MKLEKKKEEKVSATMEKVAYDKVFRCLCCWNKLGPSKSTASCHAQWASIPHPSIANPVQNTYPQQRRNKNPLSHSRSVHITPLGVKYIWKGCTSYRDNEVGWHLFVICIFYRVVSKILLISVHIVIIFLYTVAWLIQISPLHRKIDSFNPLSGLLQQSGTAWLNVATSRLVLASCLQDKAKLPEVAWNGEPAIYPRSQQPPATRTATLKDSHVVAPSNHDCMHSGGSKQLCPTPMCDVTVTSACIEHYKVWRWCLQQGSKSGFK